MRLFPLHLLVLPLFALPGYSQQPIDYDTAYLDRNVSAVRIDEEITLDELLNEPAWQLASPATDFVQWQPNSGDS